VRSGGGWGWGSDTDEIKADLSRVLFKLFSAIHSLKIASTAALVVLGSQ
jgi:hypothetical protein